MCEMIPIVGCLSIVIMIILVTILFSLLLIKGIREIWKTKHFK